MINYIKYWLIESDSFLSHLDKKTVVCCIQYSSTESFLYYTISYEYFNSILGDYFRKRKIDTRNRIKFITFLIGCNLVNIRTSWEDQIDIKKSVLKNNMHCEGKGYSKYQGGF